LVETHKSTTRGRLDVAYTQTGNQAQLMTLLRDLLIEEDRRTRERATTGMPFLAEPVRESILGAEPFRYAWMSGESLGTALRENGYTHTDFVRLVREKVGDPLLLLVESGFDGWSIRWHNDEDVFFPEGEFEIEASTTFAFESAPERFSSAA
jgi:hypothetical protein